MIMFSTQVLAEVTLADCQEDSSLQGDNKTPLQPLPECADIIKADPSKVSVTSANNRWEAFGKGKMLYLDAFDADGNLVDRVLLAGSQTELVSIQKVFIDTVYKKLFIVQIKNGQHELMVQNLLFIGNVSPLKVMRSATFNGVTSVKMESGTEIEVVNASGSFLVKADGESREELSTEKALVISPK